LKCSEEAPSHQYSIGNLKLRADFSRMTRTNLASERVFELKLVGGSLPFPPPGPAGKKLKRRGTRKTVEAEEEAAAKMPVEKLEDATLAKLPSPEEMTHDVRDGPSDDVVRFDFKPSTVGSFEFTLELEDRDDWGRIMLYKMFEAGITPTHADPRFLVVTDKKGRSTRRDREEMKEMLEVARSYPVKVSYKPPEWMNPNLWNHAGGMRGDWEIQNLLMSYIKWSITGPDAVKEHEVKYYQHKTTFQRYQIYVGESHNWWHDSFSEEEFMLKYAEAAPMVSLAIKVGPRLRDVLRGKEEILNLLFGS